MRRFLLGVVVLLLVGATACTNRVKKVEQTIERWVEEKTAPAPAPQEEDTVVIPVEEPEPVVENESFDDFLYEYASEEDFRAKRTKFPLPFYKYDEPLKVEVEEWNELSFFGEDESYSLIFDREEDLELEADASLNSIQFEWINLSIMEVTKYYFERIKGRWMLEAVNLRALEENDNEDFVRFYQRFATDPVYQQQHVKDPLTYITVDPENEFSIVESFIDAEQWPAFCPVIPTERLSNIIYGQQNNNDSNRKIMKLTGVADGLSNVLFFRRVNGEWELYKFEDTSV